MANYYHEAKAHVRRLKEFADDSKRRAERRAEFFGTKADYPINFLAIGGHEAKIHRNTELYNQMESGSGVMIDCSGDPEIKIDRYDGRALLDFIVSLKKTPRQVSEMDQLVIFESYRDLIRLKALGLSESEALRLVENENVEIRAAAKSNSAQATGIPLESKLSSLNLPSSVSSSAMAAYGSTAVLLEECQSSDSSSGDDRRRATSNRRLRCERNMLDTIAFEEFGISDFAYKIRKLLKVEGDKAALKELESSKFTGFHRQSYSGISTSGTYGRCQDFLPSRRSSSFGRSRRSRVKDGSRSDVVGRERHGVPQLISSFSGEPDNGSEENTVEDDLSWMKTVVTPRIVDVEPTPSTHDPSRLGFEQRNEARKRKYEEEQRLEALKTEESAREILEVRKKAQFKTKGVEKKETPQERIRRLMAAQLNKQAKKDAIQTTQKRIEAERDQDARKKIERSTLGLSLEGH